MLGVRTALTRVRLNSLSRPSNTHQNPQALQLQSFLPSAFRFSHNTTLSATMNPDINRILAFWYDRPSMEWFVPPEGFDQECKQNFGELVHKARANELDHWATEPKGSLALLILLDQFSRNIFRGTPEMYAADPKALDIATNSIAKGFDKEVTLYQALTFYLPLMHNESLLAQVATIALLENLVIRSANDKDAEQFHTGGLQSAKGHLNIIQRFGRFPSRNEILGRKTTEEEKKFMEENPRALAGAPSAGGGTQS